ncbi:two-component sensor histidine kinase [Diaminobutyricibacter tongyongensis]|uniref:Two-component sensor histidine kinase n=1 Tax=Leifsonia tongyongensis TaxID=1268043 RepID=A0A6L9XUX7_9MICO|nr:histidine kinase [Diaminobutyricibacter tongyongensis]NEN04864.1 two-component sensor histidine kinase [Diaminobutyricibacter tongyongensis]
MDLASRTPAERPASWDEWWGRARQSMTDRSTRGWYIGASFGLLYQVLTVIAVWLSPGSTAAKVAATVLLVIYCGIFVFLAPMVWWAPLRDRIIAVAGYWLISFAFFPLLGGNTFWLWVLVAVVSAAVFEEFAIVAVFTAVLILIPLIYGVLTDFVDSAAWSGIITFSVTSMMFGLNRQMRTVRELRQAQGEVARLAVVEERARFSRDMHDVLGHSLTVVTVKSELARRLVTLDPARAEEEIADIERLSRAALTDLRAAVAGYREMSLSTELAAAQTALAAADIEAHLPRNGEIVRPELRELFGWVLREGVTNVIRHSGARNCWVELTDDSLVVSDDGRGAGMVRVVGAVGVVGVVGVAGPDGDAITASVASHRGNGLDGLVARARSAGARVVAGPSVHGGFQLSVRKATA